MKPVPRPPRAGQNRSLHFARDLFVATIERQVTIPWTSAGCRRGDVAHVVSSGLPPRPYFYDLNGGRPR